MQAQRVISRNERWCAISNEQDGRGDCVVLLFFSSMGWLRLGWSLQSEWETMHVECLQLVLSPPSSNLAMDLCLSREAGLGQNQWLLQKQLIPGQLCV